MRKFLIALIAVCLLLLIGCKVLQRKLLFYPTHHAADGRLSVWRMDGKVIGCSRQVPAAENVWMMLHGNAGKAADRTYALPSFSDRDSVFILEYPGYGSRDGSPSRASFDAAAKEASQGDK